MPTVKGDRLADSEKLALVSPLAAGYYAWLISARRVDDFGRFRWAAAGWWEETFWRREERASSAPEGRHEGPTRVPRALFEGWFEEYTRAGLVRWYRVDGVMYGEWVNAQGKKPSDQRYHKAPEPPWSTHEHAGRCAVSAKPYDGLEEKTDPAWPPERAPVARFEGPTSAPPGPYPSTHLPVGPGASSAPEARSAPVSTHLPRTPAGAPEGPHASATGSDGEVGQHGGNGGAPEEDPVVENEQRNEAAPPESEPEPQDAEAVWRSALERLQEALSPQSFATWFRPTAGRALADGTLTIEVPSAQFRDWIRANYQEALTAALPPAVTGVNLVVAESDQGEPPPELVGHFIRMHVPELEARERAKAAAPAFLEVLEGLRARQPSWPVQRLRKMALAQLARSLR